METLKKVIIYCFSGTGNAKQVGLWFTEFAAERNIDCRMYNIAKTDIKSVKNINSDTLIIIISPIHGFNYTKITLDFIRHFPKGKNNVVLMNTRAGMKIGNYVTPGLTGIAFFLASFMLRQKGYNIKGSIPFDMPSNWISIHPSLTDKAVRFLHEKNHERAAFHANKIFAGERDFYSRRDIVQDILIAPISLGYYLMGRFALAKSFYANNDCDNCGICIRNCPVKAITTINKKPFWTMKCESCMRCMNNCPKKAIETAHVLLVTVGIVSSVLVSFFIANTTSHYIQSEPFKSIIDCLVFLFVLVVFYKIQHLLLQNKVTGKLISLISITHYKFWGRYKSIPDSKWKK